MLIAAAAAVLMAGAAWSEAPAAPELAGDWQGEITLGDQTVPVVLHFGQAVTADSPAEQRFGIAATLEHTGGVYKVTFVSGSELDLQLTPEGELKGSWSKDNLTAPLVLKRKAAPGG
jgi:hypothetical protein